MKVLITGAMGLIGPALTRELAHAGHTVTAVDRGYFSRGAAIPVRLRGGTLEITWKKDGGILMVGPARKVFEGRVWLNLEQGENEDASSGSSL